MLEQASINKSRKNLIIHNTYLSQKSLHFDVTKKSNANNYNHELKSAT
jgi:hypothetical protein